MSKNSIIKVIIDKKIWEMSKKQLKCIIEMAKQKYEKENKYAIVAVSKDGIATLLKDEFNSYEMMKSAVLSWEKSGYECYYTNN